MYTCRINKQNYHKLSFNLGFMIHVYRSDLAMKMPRLAALSDCYLHRGWEV